MERNKSLAGLYNFSEEGDVQRKPCRTIYEGEEKKDDQGYVNVELELQFA